MRIDTKQFREERQVLFASITQNVLMIHVVSLLFAINYCFHLMMIIVLNASVT